MTDAELAELLRTVIARPDDLDVLRIYADCLLERGDPRGELIAVQLERGEAARAREHELVAELERGLAATLRQPGLATTWRDGFVDAVDFEPRDGGIALADSLRKLGTLSEARRLRRIVVRIVEPGWGANGAIVSALTRLAPQLRALRELAFTTTGRAETARSATAPDRASGSNFGDVAALTRAIPRLESLEIGTKDWTSLRDAQVRNLQHLVLEHPTTYDVALLADLRMPALADLEIHGLTRILDLEAVLVRDLPLRRLAIATWLPEVMQRLSRDLPGATLCRRLDTLVLTGAKLDKTCIDYLVHGAAHLRHLRRFEITGAVDVTRLRGVLGDRLVVT